MHEHRFQSPFCHQFEPLHVVFTWFRNEAGAMGDAGSSCMCEALGSISNNPLPSL